jgi:adenylate cyclase
MFLRRKSFDVLRYLADNPGRVVTREEMLAAVWLDVTVGEEALTKCISEVRQALGDGGQSVIRTVPRRGYLVDRPGASDCPSSYPIGETASSPEKPSVAVLAFSNLSGDLAQEYISDGITEDIITELSRFSELLVIARNSTFRYKGKPVDIRRVGRELGAQYVVEGSVQRAGDRIRVSAQLIDASTGAHRWADRYDRKLADIFEVQADVARTIVSILAAHVNRAEVERRFGLPDTNWHAYDYFMQAADALASFWSSFDPVQLSRTRRLLERSVALDPKYAAAYGALSHTYVIGWTQPIGHDYLTASALDRAYDLSLAAVQLDPHSPKAYAHLGNALTWKRQHDAALAAFDKGAALNPNFTDWRLATVLIFAGEPERALRAVRTHMRLDPFHPPWALGWLGFAHYQLRHYAMAVEPMRECVARMPKYRGAHARLAAAYAQMGYRDMARAEAAAVLRIDPDYTISGDEKRVAPFRHFRDAEHLFSGLRKAGLSA